MLLQQPSRGRRPRLRPAESLRKEDVWCCAAVSWRGKMPRSSWFLGESSYRVIHRSGHPLCPQDKPHRETVRRLPPTAAPNRCALPALWISTIRAAPGGSHPTKNPTMTRGSRYSTRSTLDHLKLPTRFSCRPDLCFASPRFKRARSCTNNVASEQWNLIPPAPHIFMTTHRRCQNKIGTKPALPSK